MDLRNSDDPHMLLADTIFVTPSFSFARSFSWPPNAKRSLPARGPNPEGILSPLVAPLVVQWRGMGSLPGLSSPWVLKAG